MSAFPWQWAAVTARLVKPRRVSGLCVAVFCAGAVGAQEQEPDVPLPRWTKERCASGSRVWPFPARGRSQQQWHRDTTGARAVRIHALRYRIHHDGGAPTTLRVDGLRVVLGHAARPLASMATTFADNLGADATVVFRGTLVVPSDALQRGSTAFHVRLALDRPFAFDPRHGELLLDVTRTPRLRDEGLGVDHAIGGDHGEWQRFARGARLAHGERLTLGVEGDREGILPGGRIRVAASGLIEPRATLLAVGRDDLRWGGARLPFRVGDAGHWCVAAPAWRGMAGQALGGGRWEMRTTLAIPDNDWLVGRRLHLQAVTIDPRASSLGFVFSDALRVTIGQGEAPCSMVVAGSPDAAAGEMLHGGVGGAVLGLETGVGPR